MTRAEGQISFPIIPQHRRTGLALIDKTALRAMGKAFSRLHRDQTRLGAGVFGQLVTSEAGKGDTVIVVVSGGHVHLTVFGSAVDTLVEDACNALASLGKKSGFPFPEFGIPQRQLTRWTFTQVREEREKLGSLLRIEATQRDMTGMKAFAWQAVGYKDFVPVEQEVNVVHWPGSRIEDYGPPVHEMARRDQ